MNEFQRQVKEFFTQLGVSEKKISSFLESGSKDFRQFLISKKARRLGYQKDVRKACGHRGLVNIKENVVITSTNEAGILISLAQDIISGQCVYPSEGTVEWLYHSKTAIEPPILSAYHKLFEIVKDLDVTLEYFGEKTSTIVQENRDIIYEISLFYKAHLPRDEYEKIAKRNNWIMLALYARSPY